MKRVAATTVAAAPPLQADLDALKSTLRDACNTAHRLAEVAALLTWIENARTAQEAIDHLRRQPHESGQKLEEVLSLYDIRHPREWGDEVSEGLNWVLADVENSLREICEQATQVLSGGTQ